LITVVNVIKSNTHLIYYESAPNVHQKSIPKFLTLKSVSTGIGLIY